MARLHIVDCRFFRFLFSPLSPFPHPPGGYYVICYVFTGVTRHKGTRHVSSLVGLLLKNYFRYHAATSTLHTIVTRPSKLAVEERLRCASLTDISAPTPPPQHQPWRIPSPYGDTWKLAAKFCLASVVPRLAIEAINAKFCQASP